MSSDAYDAIIIGAGIGGLVCGCYLAKAGMKVLICEQHYKPGGYCTSFKRGPFTFDAAAHRISGYKHGILGKIFRDLTLDKKLRCIQYDPSDIVISPDYRISFCKKIFCTISELQSEFDAERNNIKKFFNFIIETNYSSLLKTRNLTFKNILDQYFHNEKLKSLLSFPLFGSTGLPPSRLSAFIGIGIFKESILDNGYYPESGMQAIPDILSTIFREYGGEILLSSFVKEIRIHNNKVEGVVLNTNTFIASKYVISNCDIRQTCFKLIKGNLIDKSMSYKITKLLPSLSAFILYLGVKDLPEYIRGGSSIWILSDYDLDNIYYSAKKGFHDKIGGYLLHVSHDRRCMTIIKFAPFNNKIYWEQKKKEWAKAMTEKIETDLSINLSSHVLHQEIATPQTLYKYTLNYKGAAFGWEAIPNQLALSDFNQSFVKGLFFTGHWTTYGLGIPSVMYNGYETARLVLRKSHIRKI